MTAAPTGVRRIRSEADAVALARWLRDGRRDWPVVLVTISSGQAEPFGDPDAVAEAVHGLAEVVLLPTRGPSWAFSRSMPPSTQVYGGAGRVYPVGDDWVTDPHRARLRFAYCAEDRARVTDQLVSDALAAAGTAGLGRVNPYSQVQSRTGVVEGIVGSRALIRLNDASLAVVWEELTVPGVTLDRVLTAGQQVTGLYDPASRRLDVRPALLHPTPAAARDAVTDTYQEGDVIWTDVAAITADTVTLRLLPGLTAVVHRDAVTGNAQDLMGELFTTGEAVAARISAIDAGGVRLRIDSVDGDTPQSAPSLLPGGPAWLPPPPGEAIAARAPIAAVASPLAAGVPRQATPLDLARRHTPSAPPDPALPEPAPPGPAPDAVAPVAPSPALLARATRSAAFDAERTARDSAERELEALRTHAAALQNDLARAEQRIENLQTRYRTADLARQRALRQLRRHQDRSDAGGIEPSGDAPAFLDDEDQFRHEVYTEWARRIPAAEKATKPLADYCLASGFLTSLDNLQGISRVKVVSVVVEVLTGQAPHLAGRDLHQLRAGSNGSNYHTRADGATCWRVALQRGTASARRMHYWRTADGYELSRVTVHDDYQP
ncbi:hypothetical protein AB0H28_27245 [Micromonospora sp. NPDC050980]|uniref:hypothetical protein n=1 Tax=Micromonospora sp. NPDC050980 TaxID=3155161 RepID=UPI0033EFBDEC